MNRSILMLFLLCLCNNLFSQINYYVGFDLLSTTSKVVENDKENYQNNINYSTYIGNEINVNNKYALYLSLNVFLNFLKYNLVTFAFLGCCCS